LNAWAETGIIDSSDQEAKQMTKYLGKYISAMTGRTVEVQFSTDGNPRAWVFANRPVSRLISVFPWGN
jgi:hypothetical protein